MHTCYLVPPEFSAVAEGRQHFKLGSGDSHCGLSGCPAFGETINAHAGIQCQCVSQLGLNFCFYCKIFSLVTIEGYKSLHRVFERLWVEEGFCEGWLAMFICRCPNLL